MTAHHGAISRLSKSISINEKTMKKFDSTIWKFFMQLRSYYPWKSSRNAWITIIMPELCKSEKHKNQESLFIVTSPPRIANVVIGFSDK